MSLAFSGVAHPDAMALSSQDSLSGVLSLIQGLGLGQSSWGISASQLSRKNLRSCVVSSLLQRMGSDIRSIR
jgi:hypothetical protein